MFFLSCFFFFFVFGIWAPISRRAGRCGGFGFFRIFGGIFDSTPNPNNKQNRACFYCQGQFGDFPSCFCFSGYSRDFGLNSRLGGLKFWGFGDFPRAFKNSRLHAKNPSHAYVLSSRWMLGNFHVFFLAFWGCVGYVGPEVLKRYT